MNDSFVKATFIKGLKPVVLTELTSESWAHVVQEHDEAVYLVVPENLRAVLGLRSILRASLVVQNNQLNPKYLAKHKSVLGGLVAQVLKLGERFATFQVTCAGAHTPEVQSINEYLANEFKLSPSNDPDLKVHIIKLGEMWEVGVQLTSRPLALRDYRTANLSGAMNPTIAFALNSLCDLNHRQSYLNAFSGSATLLIEAGLVYPKLERLLGFDNNKEHLTLSIKNIRAAGLIRRIQIKQADILDAPDFGKFDVITADLPFGMLISKGEDLAELYRSFLEFCQRSLNQQGIIAVYTAEHELLLELIKDSPFRVTQTLELEFMTASGSYLRPQIILAEFR